MTVIGQFPCYLNQWVQKRVCKWRTTDWETQSLLKPVTLCLLFLLKVRHCLDVQRDGQRPAGPQHNQPGSFQDVEMEILCILLPSHQLGQVYISRDLTSKSPTEPDPHDSRSRKTKIQLLDCFAFFPNQNTGIYLPLNSKKVKILWIRRMLDFNTWEINIRFHRTLNVFSGN